MTEKNLVSKLRRGDKASFDELFNRYFEQCFTYAVSLLKDPDAAEDVVQNVFLKLWSGRERLDSSRQFRSYLLTAVRNESISCFVPSLLLTGNAVRFRNLWMKPRIS